jgi:DNA gyrase subunit A
MIINKSGILIRVKVADIRIMGRATQGVKLINLEKRGDEIGSICKVPTDVEEEEMLAESMDAEEMDFTGVQNHEENDPDLNNENEELSEE